jgi:hypothetical protein
MKNIHLSALCCYFLFTGCNVNLDTAIDTAEIIQSASNIKEVCLDAYGRLEINSSIDDSIRLELSAARNSLKGDMDGVISSKMCFVVNDTGIATFTKYTDGNDIWPLYYGPFDMKLSGPSYLGFNLKMTCYRQSQFSLRGFSGFHTIETGAVSNDVVPNDKYHMLSYTGYDSIYVETILGCQIDGKYVDKVQVRVLKDSTGFRQINIAPHMPYSVRVILPVGFKAWLLCYTIKGTILIDKQDVNSTVFDGPLNNGIPDERKIRIFALHGIEIITE